MNCDETETLPSNILKNLRKKYITNPLIFEFPEILIPRCKTLNFIIFFSLIISFFFLLIRNIENPRPVKNTTTFLLILKRDRDRRVHERPQKNTQRLPL